MFHLSTAPLFLLLIASLIVSQTLAFLRKVPPSISLMPRYVSRHRSPIIGGNWKSNGTRQSVGELVSILNSGLISPDVEVVVAPPTIHIGSVKDSLKKGMALSTQNVALHDTYGAYTGEMSAAMIKDYGVPWTIVGHSERRQGFGMPGESNVLVAKKTANAVNTGLKVMACIGEKLEDRESGKTDEVLSAQLEAIKDAIKDVSQWKDIVIAYEPVWAIGTGKTASPETAQETHHGIRKWLEDNVGREVASSTRIMYGGSVKGSNAYALASKPDIDGFLVGGAALTEDFLKIIGETARRVQEM